MKPSFKITITKTSYSVEIVNSKKSFFANGNEQIVKGFMNNFKTYRYDYDRKSKRFKKKPDKTYASYAELDDVYRFPIKTLKSFIHHLARFRVPKEALEIVKPESKIKHGKIDYKLNKAFKLRDYQKKYFEHLTDLSKPIHLVDLQTGKGKGLIAISSVLKINKRVLVIVLPKYIEKWIKELKELIPDLKDDEITVLKGKDSINNILALAECNELNYKCLIASNRTMGNYIKDYETTEDEDDFIYYAKPQDFTEKVGIGVSIYDEVHQEFFSVAKNIMYFSCDKVIGLSATLKHRDSNMNKQYANTFPEDIRLKFLTYDKYINIISCNYSFTDPRYIKIGLQYSQSEFEKSIMRNSIMLKNYLEMIAELSDLYYINKKEKGDRLAIFCGTIRLCTIVTNYLKKRYKKLSVLRYVDDDPFENVIKPDIRVSTIQSSGTAIDIPKLITVINTINVLSIQSNEQTLGRLRRLEGKETTFIYTFANNIKKHIMYNEERIKMLKPLSKDFSFIRHEKLI